MLKYYHTFSSSVVWWKVNRPITTHRECLSLLLLCTYILARYYLERAYVGVNLTRVCLSSCMLCVYWKPPLIESSRELLLPHSLPHPLSLFFLFFFLYPDKCSGIRVGTYHAPRGRKHRVLFFFFIFLFNSPIWYVALSLSTRIDTKSPSLLFRWLLISLSPLISIWPWIAIFDCCVPFRVSSSSFHRICTRPSRGLQIDVQKPPHNCRAFSLYDADDFSTGNIIINIAHNEKHLFLILYTHLNSIRF